MYNRIKNIVQNFREYNLRIIEQNELLLKQQNAVIESEKESEWANIFNSSINDKPWLKSLSLSPGRWAANYSLLYVLVRILSDYKPLKVIEFGLGESSKVISSFLDNELTSSLHWIIEQDPEWERTFKSRFRLSERSVVKQYPLAVQGFNEHEVNSYQGIEGIAKEKFDLYIIDGPFGSKAISRIDIMHFVEHFTAGDEFMILVDDYERDGEKEMVRYLQKVLESKK